MPPLRAVKAELVAPIPPALAISTRNRYWRNYDPFYRIGRVGGNGALPHAITGATETSAAGGRRRSLRWLVSGPHDCSFTAPASVLSLERCGSYLQPGFVGYVWVIVNSAMFFHSCLAWSLN